MHSPFCHPDDFYYNQASFIVHLILHLLWHPIPFYASLSYVRVMSHPFFVFSYKPLEMHFLFGKKKSCINWWNNCVYLYFIIMCFCYFVHPPFSHLTAFIVRKKKTRFRAWWKDVESLRGLFSPYILQTEGQMLIDSRQYMSEVLWRAIGTGNDDLARLSAEKEEQK